MIRTPLKFKFSKKSGRYSLSQDVYVLSIFIGEYPILQCTLTTESPAKDCIEYLRQKSDLNQVEMLFGLRYQMRCNDPDKRIMRWVEMDKPLRKQLDKWACKPRQVQLAILYHTPNAFTLTDQMARSYYFLMMKLDVVEGRLTLEMEKYINLAALCLQVEYGDYDSAIHTVDFMRSLQLLPTSICRSAQIMEDLLKRVSLVHERLSGMQPSYAALLYIVDAQQSEGYGEEFFNARDEDSSEVNLGYSPDGVVVKRSYAAPLKYAWQDIKEIYGSKRHLIVKCKDSTIVEFTLEDADMVRYLVILFNWQFRYAMTDAIIHRNVPMDINNLQGSIKTFNSTAYHKFSTADSLKLPTNRTHSSTSTRTNSVASSQCFLPTGPTSSYFNVNAAIDANRLSSFSFRTPINTVDRTRAASVVGACLSNGSVGSLLQSTSSPKALEALRTYNLSTSGGLYHGAAFQQPFSSLHAVPDVSVHPQPVTQMKRQFLKAKIGSSPEIHMVGAVQNKANQKSRTRTELLQRAPRSNPDLTSKWRSTPDLQSMVRDRQLQLQSNEISDADSAMTMSPASLGYSTGHVISGNNYPHGHQIVYPAPAPRSHSKVSTNSSSATTGAKVTTISTYLPVNADHHHFLSNIESPNHITSVTISCDSDALLADDMRHPVSTSSCNILCGGGVLAGQYDTLTGKSTSSNSTDCMLNSLLQKLASDELLQEFNSIPKKRHSAGSSTSQLPENQRRNRNNDSIPYEDARVMLHPHKKNVTGYINASNVQILLGNKMLRYTITQSPLQETVEDFWQMIWETNSEVIVQLCEAQAGKHSAVPFYWPTTSKGKLSLNNFSVKMNTVTAGNFQITTILTLKCTSNGERRTVYHMEYSAFDKTGVPRNEDSFLGFIDAVNSVKRHVENEKMLESDSGISSAVSTSRSKSRSRSTSRANLSDVTNRRSQSMDGSRRRLRFPNSASDLSSSECSSTSGGIPPTLIAQSAAPITVVCLDGAKSGLYVLVDVLIRGGFEQNINMDIARTLRVLRQQRMHLVRFEQQYRFVHSLIAQYLRKSRLI